MKVERCQCTDCQNLEQTLHLNREFPTFKQHQEFNLTTIQSLWSICSKVSEEQQNQWSFKGIKDKSVENNKYITDTEFFDILKDLEYINAYFL